jgi:NagD protein
MKASYALSHSSSRGARLIGTNPDITGPGEYGIIPACGALIAPIEIATRRKAYFIGKPNPLMMRTGIRRLGVAREEAAIIGDRMDTDIISGIESELDTVLVLSGVTTRDAIREFPYTPQVHSGWRRHHCGRSLNTAAEDIILRQCRSAKSHGRRHHEDT